MGSANYRLDPRRSPTPHHANIVTADLMPDIVVLELVAAAAIILLASTVFSALGFGIGLVAMPLLLLLFDAQTAVVTLESVTLPIVVLMLAKNRSYLRVKETLPIAIAGLVGGFIGAFVLKNADSDLLSITILILILTFTALNIFNLNIRWPLPRVMGPALGLLVGVLIISTGVGGPLVVMFMLAQGWNRHSLRVSMALYLMFMESAGIAGFVVGGLYTPERLTLLAAVLVPCLLGFWLGNNLAYRMSDVIFRRVVIGLILVASVVGLVRQIGQI